MTWLEDLGARLRQSAQEQGQKPVLETGGDVFKGALRGSTADVLGTPVDLATQFLPPERSANPYAKAIRNLFGAQTPTGGSDWWAQKMGLPESQGMAYEAGRMLSPNPLELVRALRTAGPALKIFAGEGAEKAPIDAMQKAFDMEVAGATPAETWQAHQVYRNPLDFRQRFEISDQAMNIRDPNWTRAPDASTPRKISEVVDHPELFANYPQLEEMTIRTDPKLRAGGPWGYFDPIKKEIALSPVVDWTGKMQKDVLVHELQHSVQEIENFARGGNTSMFDPATMSDLKRNWLKIKGDEIQEIGGRINELSKDPRYVQAVEKQKLAREYQIQREAARRASAKDPAYAKYAEGPEDPKYVLSQEDKDILKQMDDYRGEFAKVQQEFPYQDEMAGYMHLGGEVEARLADLRRRYTPEKRAAEFPLEHMVRMGYPVQTQIYRGPEGMAIGKKP